MPLGERGPFIDISVTGSNSKGIFDMTYNLSCILKLSCESV